MNIYKELKDRHQRELDKFPFFFAFNDKQFEDGKKKLGVKDNNELYVGTGGMIYRRSDSKRLHDMAIRFNEEMETAMKDDKFLRDAFYYELINHEYGYTYDLTDTLEALGITEKQLEKDERIQRILAEATSDYMRRYQ